MLGAAKRLGKVGQIAMFGKLVGSLRHLRNVRLDQRKHDAALPGYFNELGIRLDGRIKVEGNRFDILSFEDAKGRQGLCTYGLSGFLVGRGTELLRIELLIYQSNELSMQLLVRTGRAIYMSYELPGSGKNRNSAGEECFEVVRQKGLLISGQRAHEFIALEIMPR